LFGIPVIFLCEFPHFLDKFLIFGKKIIALGTISRSLLQMSNIPTTSVIYYIKIAFNLCFNKLYSNPESHKMNTDLQHCPMRPLFKACIFGPYTKVNIFCVELYPFRIPNFVIIFVKLIYPPTLLGIFLTFPCLYIFSAPFPFIDFRFSFSFLLSIFFFYFPFKIFLVPCFGVLW
jgi:hypothetical protein